jgi:hypothetical protein
MRVRYGPSVSPGNNQVDAVEVEPFSGLFENDPFPEYIKGRIDERPDHIGSNQVEEFDPGGAIVPDHQEYPHRDR